MTRTLLASCALISPILLAAPANADELYLALSPSLSDDTGAVIEAARGTFEMLRPDSKLHVLNADTGKTVVSFEIDDKPRYERINFITKDYGVQLRTFQNFVQDVSSGSDLDPTPTSSGHFKTFRAIGELRIDTSEPAHLLLIMPGLHDVPQNPSLSMVSDQGIVQVPSDHYQLGDLSLSPYGRSEGSKPLENTFVHFCASLPELTQYQRDEILRFWSHNIALKGGTLSTFSTDLKSCVSRYNEKVTDPIAVRPVDKEIGPAMIAADMSGRVTQVTISSHKELETELRDKSKAYETKIAELERSLSKAHEDAAREKDELVKLNNELKRYKEALGLSAKGEVTDFSKFTRVPHPYIPTLTIMTGVGYDEGFPDRYDSSWCYFNRENDAGAKIRIDIGKKFQGQSVTWDRVSDSVLAETDLTQRDLKAARQSCRFPQG